METSAETQDKNGTNSDVQNGEVNLIESLLRSHDKERLSNEVDRQNGIEFLLDEFEEVKRISDDKILNFWRSQRNGQFY